MPNTNAILSELIEFNSRPSLQENEFTLSDYKETWENENGENIPDGTARDHLRRMEEKGIITSRRVFIDGYYYRAYRKVDNESEGN